MKKRVAITGVGIIDPLGANKNECFNNLINDFNPMSPITKFNLTDYPNISVNVCSPVDFSKCQYSDPSLDKSPPYIKLSMHAVEQALASAGHPEKDTTNVGVVFSSMGTSGDTRVDFSVAIEQKKKRFSPRALLENLPDFMAGHISRTYKFTGISTSTNAACATGLASIDYAIKQLDNCDFVIAGGSDCMIDTTHIFSFQILIAASQTASFPFDAKRSGFVMGEGAACLVLEYEDRARARGAHIYGFIDGVALANDSYSQTSPDPSGAGAEMAMTKAWEQAGRPVVDFVNAHATATPAGDIVEYETIRRMFPDAPIYSSKGKIGHTMAACGIAELIHGLGSFENNVIPKTFGITESIAPNDKNLLTENLNRESKVFIKNSFGFGGRCASIVVSKE